MKNQKELTSKKIEKFIIRNQYSAIALSDLWKVIKGRKLQEKILKSEDITLMIKIEDFSKLI